MVSFPLSVQAYLPGSLSPVLQAVAVAAVARVEQAEKVAMEAVLTLVFTCLIMELVVTLMIAT